MSLVPIRIVITLYSFLTLLAYTSSSHGIGTTPGDESSKDFQALLCLRNHLSNNAEALALWNNTLQYCSWPGVTCGKNASRVTALDLESLGLNGQIPPCIGNLTFLTRINLAGNLLNGRIPPEVGHLARLVHLNLTSNNFTGAIPDSFTNCSSLQIIALGSNSLQGSIPDGFGILPKLSVLFVPSNHLTGNIPYSLGSSSSLVYVNLTHNSLTGGIPPLLANSSSLMGLDLSHNSLGGEMPPALFNSSSLLIISFAQNNLVGSIPHFTHISPLVSLDLSFNNLAGEIPSSAGNSSSLIELLLAGNHLQGSIPWSLSKLPYLQRLDLTVNNLSGTVPGSLYNISTLAYLGMGVNGLVGEIPETIGQNLPNIQTFVARENKFQGRIPISMVNATNLQVIDLSDNAFNGIVPSFESLLNLSTLDLSRNQLEAGDWTFLPSLASCSMLVRLQLESNNLQGELPNSIGQLPKSLEILSLAANKIAGTIPQEIGNLTNLTLISMEQNLLSGNLPESLGNLPYLFVLSLSQNKLSGQIPPSVGNLGQLSELYLQQNYLSGPIPVALGQCTKLHTLNLSCNSFDGRIPKELFTLSTLAEGLDLSYNKLSGPIPMEIGGLINLSPLNISNNQLTGEIPSTLGECLHLESLHLEGNLLDGRIPQSFAALRGISDMDLSRNNLSGQVPEFFEAFDSMSLLNLSFNNLEGPIPTGGIFQNASKVFVQGNKELCAVSSPLNLPRCQTDSSKHMHTSNILKIVGLSAVSLVLISFFGVIFLKKRNKVKQEAHPSIKGLKKLTYDDLVKATNGFSLANLVGSGKYGSVYKGRIESEEHVAIKVFKLEQLGATKSFLTECEALRNTRHRNLVRVITVCSTIDHTGHEFKALVLEYMINGNLESWLHPALHEHHPKRPLSLGSRIVIVVDIAAALDYLHNHCMPPMAHCDLKPSNVLLDDVMGACVGDFGLAKFLHSHTSSGIHNSTSIVGPRGSVGYIAPEYGFGSKISTEGDVYSYGIIILEILTGKRPTDEMFNDGLSLYKFVKQSFPQNIGDILDPTIIPSYGDEAGSMLDQENHPMAGTMSCIIELVKLGLSCAAEASKDRPAIQDVYSEITAIKEVFSALQG